MRILPALAIIAVVACTPRDDAPADTVSMAPASPTATDTGLAAAPRPVDTTQSPPAEKQSPGPVVPGPSFRLVGNEPFWSVQVDSTRIRYLTPEDSAGERFPAVRPVQMGDTLRWVTSNPRTILEATVVTGACSDGMSDKAWTHKASVQVGDRKLSGCAERR